MTVAAHRLAGRIIRWVLGAIFLVAAVGKLPGVHRVGESDLFAALSGGSVALLIAICIGEAPCWGYGCSSACGHVPHRSRHWLSAPHF